MARITAVINQKGGVSKTTAAMNLAAVTNQALAGDPDHSPVLVVAADPQQSSDWWADRLKDMPFDHASVEHPDELRRLPNLGKYRQILVDTPGTLEDPRVPAILDVIDDALVPLPPDPLAVAPTARTISQVLVPKEIPYRVFVTMWDPREGREEINPELAEAKALATAQGWPVTVSSIPKYKVIKRLALEGKVITQYPPGDRTATISMNAFLRLALEVGLGHPLGVMPAVSAGTPSDTEASA